MTNGNFSPTFRHSPSWLTSTGCPETSLRNYHYSLRNNSEERSSELLRGGSMKRRKKAPFRRSAITQRSQITEAPFHALFKKVVPVCTAVITVSLHRDEAQTKSLPVTLRMYSSLNFGQTASLIQCRESPALLAQLC